VTISQYFVVLTRVCPRANNQLIRQRQSKGCEQKAPFCHHQNTPTSNHKIKPIQLIIFICVDLKNTFAVLHISNRNKMQLNKKKSSYLQICFALIPFQSSDARTSADERPELINVEQRAYWVTSLKSAQPHAERLSIIVSKARALKKA
jgi:hypothetical protein